MVFVTNAFSRIRTEKAAAIIFVTGRRPMKKHDAKTEARNFKIVPQIESVVNRVRRGTRLYLGTMRE